MSRTVTVGLDGSPESLAAADWAAREALLRAAPLRLVHAGEQQPHAHVPFAGRRSRRPVRTGPRRCCVRSRRTCLVVTPV